MIRVATVSFRIDDEIKERLDAMAEDRGLNVSHIFRQALVEKLTAIEPKAEGETQLPLTIKERLSLVLQLRTLAAVESDAHNKKHLDTQIDALTSGYEFHYADLICHFDNGLSNRACKEVLDILDMYSELLWGFEALTDKAGIEKSDVEFPGFDGNYETRYLCYANYFLFDLDRYQSMHQHVKAHRCNSHCPMLEIYKRMLDVFLPIRRQSSSQRLSAQSIKAILAARGY